MFDDGVLRGLNYETVSSDDATELSQEMFLKMQILNWDLGEKLLASWRRFHF